MLLVVASHAGVPGFGFAGQVGVTMFFVLSGFLITTLLFDERDRTGRIDLAAFYWRRALRLLPALIMVIVFVGLALRDWLPSLWAVSYVGNWARIVGNDLGPLNHTWSLAIEEQFYIVWPLALIGACALRLSRRTMLAGMLGLVGVAFVTRVVLITAPGTSLERIMFGTDMQGGALLLGCAVAASGITRRSTLGRIAAMAGLAVACLAPGGIIADWTLWVTFAMFASAALILNAGEDQRWLTSSPLVFTGRISYGLYLWHFAIATVWADAFDLLAWPIRLLALSVVTFAVASASYYGVEQWFLQRKRNRSAPVASGVPA